MEETRDRLEDGQRPKRRSDELGDKVIVMLLENQKDIFKDVESMKASVEALRLTDEQTAALLDELRSSKMDTPGIVLLYRSHKKKLITALIGMLGTVIWASTQAKIQALWHWFLKL